MIRRPPRSTRTDTLLPSRRSSDLVTPAPGLATGKGYLFALADGVSQCADGGLAARATLQALAFDYYATPETWAVAQSLDRRSEEHTSELQSLMRNSYAVFCLK